MVGAVKVEKPPLPETRVSNKLSWSAVTVWFSSSLLTMVSSWPGLTDGGTVYVMFEITIWGPATGAPGELVTGVDGIAATDDCPDEGGEAVEGDDWLPPPHAVRAAVVSRMDEITLALRLMVLPLRTTAERIHGNHPGQWAPGRHHREPDVRFLYRRSA